MISSGGSAAEAKWCAAMTEAAAETHAGTGGGVSGPPASALAAAQRAVGGRDAEPSSARRHAGQRPARRTRRSRPAPAQKDGHRPRRGPEPARVGAAPGYTKTLRSQSEPPWTSWEGTQPSTVPHPYVYAVCDCAMVKTGSMRRARKRRRGQMHDDPGPVLRLHLEPDREVLDQRVLDSAHFYLGCVQGHENMGPRRVRGLRILRCSPVDARPCKLVVRFEEHL